MRNRTLAQILYKRNKIRKLMKKRGAFLVVLFVFFLIAIPTGPAQYCCFDPNDLSTFCLLFPDTSNCPSSYINVTGKGISSCDSPLVPECQEGCCICTNGTKRFLHPDKVTRRYFCDQFCSQFSGFYPLFNASIKDASLCYQQITNLANLSGTITDSSTGNPIPNALVQIDGSSTKTDQNGRYKFENLLVKTYTLIVSATNYKPASFSLALQKGDNSFDVQLQPVVTFTLSGNVKDEQGKPLQGVTITATSSTSQYQTKTDKSGHYSIKVQQDTYAVEAFSPGYEAETKTATITKDTQVDFTLKKEPTATVEGYVIDKITSQYIPLAELTFIRKDKPVKITTHTSATGYHVILPVKRVGSTEYTIVITKPSYQPVQERLLLLPGDKETKDFVLTPFGAGCSYLTLAKPKNFKANHIRGVKAVLLTWQKPCETVIGYKIFRGNFEATISDPDQVQFKDEDVEWDTEYTYSIKAIYPNGESDVAESKIKTGSAECEGKTTEFCKGKSRYVCSDENQPVELESCSVACFGPDARGNTYCVDPGQCSSASLGADPFGLYFNVNLCHSQPFCYYDRFTFLYKCQACDLVKSCFDYRSELACNQDACGIGNCKWLPIVPDLGLGICTQIGYDKEDKCDLCNQPFLSGKCSSQQCQELGKCRFDQSTKTCLKCSTGLTCYNYTDKYSCDSTWLDPATNQIVPSKDHCGLGTCRWTGIECIKDGDADYKDDCSLTDSKCRGDNKRPETTIETIKVTSSNPEILFTTEENAKIYYCISATKGCNPQNELKADASGKATLDVTSINLPRSSSNKYYVSFYAVDEHNNRELEVKTKEIYVDVTPPKLDVYSDVSFSASNNATIYVTIVADEIVFCTDHLRSQSMLKDQRIDYSTTVIYSGFSPDIYNYEITCKDLVGNEVTEKIRIDAQDPFITQVLPKRVTKERTISVQVKTQGKANCSLYQNNAFIEQLSTTDGIVHSSSSTFSYSRSGFYSPFSVRCKEFATNKVRERKILFTIDTDPPKTILQLTSASKSYTAYDATGWPSFTEPVTITAECRDSPSTGFGCKQVLYCLADLGKSCDPADDFKKLLVSGSTTICYKSVDNGGNEEATKCGTIAVNKPLGVRLVYPRFGVSTNPSFTLKIKTDKPAQECRFAADSFTYQSGIRFDKDSTTEFHFSDFPRSVYVWNREFNATDGTSYSQGTIPYETYLLHVQCKEMDGSISKEQKFLLRYDPTPPKITRSYVSEGVEFGTEVKSVTTNAVLNIETDDETVCGYSRYTKKFDSMSSGFPGFPGWSVNDYKTKHSVVISTDQLNDRTTYTYYVVCRNLAGVDSPVSVLRFTVDKKAQGVIISAKPIINQTKVTLVVETNKEADCWYTDELNATFDFPQKNAQFFSASFDKKKEGRYHYVVSCTFTASGLTQTVPVDIVIDLTEPTITSIELGDNTCDSTQIHPIFKAEDPGNLSDIVLYEWVIEGDNVSINGSSAQDSPLIDGLSLEIGKSYTLKVRCKDAAGFYSDWSSVTFSVKDPDDPVCKERGPPNVTIVESEIPNGKNVEIVCSDENGCGEIYYGLSQTEEECSPTLQYTGQIFVSETSVLCYSASDTVGNQVNGSKRIVVEVVKIQDSDLDGVPDEQDKCPDTPSDKVLDIDTNSSSEYYGCAPDEIDSDSDGMPDYWEEQYGLDPNDPNDADLDNDNDGYSNLEEYRKGTDPTVLNDADLDSIPDKFDKCPNTPPSETPYVIKNPASEYYGCSKSEIPRKPIFGKLILLLLILLLLAGGGFFIYKYRSRIFPSKFPAKRPAVKPCLLYTSPSPRDRG